MPQQAAPRKARKTNGGRMTANQRIEALERELLNTRELAVRATIAARLGKSYSDKRDIYTALGYTKNPLFADYQARYQRQDIARAVVDKPVKASWRRPPTLTESDDHETQLEKEWVELVDRLHLWRYFQRLDRLAGIGSYAALFLGFDDSPELTTPVTRAGKLLYVMPYNQNSAQIDRYVTDTQDIRYGLPEFYSVTLKRGRHEVSKTVHWTRMLHVAEDPLDNDVEGIPRLRPVLNRLQDLELVSGGSAEMFWRGAFPGIAAMLRQGANIQGQALTELEDELDKYIHGFQRWLRVKGMDINQLAPQVADPSKHVGIYLDLISAASGIPKRILMGSERGELASSMDEQNWVDTIENRQKDHCEAMIIRPFIDRLMKVGVLSEAKEGYTLEWPDLRTKSDRQKAEVGEIIARALKAYVESVGAEQYLPPAMFLKKLGLSDDEIAQAEEMLKAEVAEEYQEIEEQETEAA